MRNPTEGAFQQRPLGMAALGWVFYALRESGLRAYMPTLDWWIDVSGACWKVAWQRGPYADEAAREIMRFESDAYGRRGVARHSYVVPELIGEYTARLSVFATPVVLYALRPVGYDRFRPALGRAPVPEPT